MKNIILPLFIIFFSLTSTAAVSPLSVSIVPPLQFPADNFSITGIRTSVLWGQHRDVYGFDIGLLGNITEQRFVGTGVSGLFNWTKGNSTIVGLQASGLFNYNENKTTVTGLQLSAFNWNTASSSIIGVQLGLANQSAHTSVYGLQAGIYNKAESVYGFQIGLVNVTNNLKGIQIGLINYHRQGTINVSPILNIGF